MGAIDDALGDWEVKPQLSAGVHDLVDPMRELIFTILATFTEFKADLIRLRTREGTAVACAKGKPRRKRPKPSDRQRKKLRRMSDAGEYAISDLAGPLAIARPTVYQTPGRQPAMPTVAAA